METFRSIRNIHDSDFYLFEFFRSFLHKISFVKVITSLFGANAIFGLIQRLMAFKWYIIHGYGRSINKRKIQKEGAI